MNKQFSRIFYSTFSAPIKMLFHAPPLFKLIIYEQENPTADIWISATTFPEMAKSRGMIQMGGRIAVYISAWQQGYQLLN